MDRRCSFTYNLNLMTVRLQMVITTAIAVSKKYSPPKMYLFQLNIRVYLLIKKFLLCSNLAFLKQRDANNSHCHKFTHNAVTFSKCRHEKATAMLTYYLILKHNMF